MVSTNIKRFFVTRLSVKHLSVIVLIVLFVSCGSTEKVLDYYPSGQLMNKGFKKNGELHYCWTTYRENGELFLKQRFKKGKLHGLSKTYYDDGTLRSRERFKMGNLEGVSKSFYSMSEGYGKLHVKKHYKKNKLNGLYKEYFFDTRNLWKKGYFVNDKMEGVWRWYHYNGNLSHVGNYINDVRDGFFQFFWDNFNKGEQLQSEGYYKDGLKEGLWKNYQEGKIEKEIVFFDAKGSLWAIMT